MRRWLTVAAYAALCTGALVSAINLYALLRDVRMEAAAAQSSSRDDLVWYATQYRLELAELVRALRSYILEANPNTLEEAQRRLDVFWSRLDSGGQGSLGRLFFSIEGAREAVQAAWPVVKRLDPILNGDSTPEVTGLADALRALRALEAMFQDAVFAALRKRESANVASAERLALRASQIGFLSAGGVAFAAGVALLLLFERTRLSALRTQLEKRFRASTEQLRESEHRSRLLTENAPEAIVVLDSSAGTLVEANQNAATLFKRSMAGLIGSSPGELSPARQPDGRASRDAAREYIEQALRGETPTFEWLHLNDDGEEVPCEVRLVSMPAGEHVLIRGSLLDITERRRTERELARHREELEALVDERTQELLDAQRELLRNERLAAIGELTGTVSHELRNPLGTISASFSVLRARIDDGDERTTRTLNRIDRSIQRCVNIIDELLDYARLRELSPSPVDLDPWMSSIIKELRAPDGITLDARLESGARVHVDPERMRQVVMNLVQNAFNAISENEPMAGQGRVTILTRDVVDGVEVHVHDSGPGVPEELRERIFEPLFSTRSFGVGLGLPLVRRIAEQHLGQVELRDTAGGGALFVVSLPRVGQPGEGKRRTRAPSSAHLE